MTSVPVSPDLPPLDSTVQSGLRWTLVRQIVTGLAGTAGVLGYARLLTPEDLGAVALAFLVYNGLFLLVQAPIRDAVVYYGRDGGETDSAAFWLLLGFSLAATLLVVALADLFAGFYQSAQAAGLTRGIVAAFFLQGMAVVPAALLLRTFRFAAHEILATIYLLAVMGGWIVLAARGAGPWSLITPQIVGGALWAASTWIAAGFRPLARPPREAFGKIIHFSRSLFGSRLILYLRNNIDNAAVGRLGEQALGWYSFGEDQSAFAVLTASQTAGQVALPALAAIRERKDEFRSLYLDLLRLTATFSTPMQIGALVLGDLGMVFIFGDQWMGAVPVLRAYLGFRLVDALLMVVDSATSAVGRPDLRFKVDLIQLPFFVAATLIGLRMFGTISGVAWSLAAVRAAAGIAYLVAGLRVAGVNVRPVLGHLLPSTLAAGVMGLAVHGLRLTGFAQGWVLAIPQTFISDGLTLTGLVTAGAAIYFGLLYGMDRRGFGEVARLGRRILIPDRVRRL